MIRCKLFGHKWTSFNLPTWVCSRCGGKAFGGGYWSGGAEVYPRPKPRTEPDER